MPRYLIGRWNIKVTLAYKGLLWVGGPQVDPGWVGHLFCPIYNLSDHEVTIRCGDEIAVIDFVKTTPFDKASVGESEHDRYRWPPKRVILEDYGIDDLKSALYHHVKERVDQMDEGVRAVEARLAWFTQIVFTTLALIVGSMSFLVGRTGALNLATSLWGTLVITLAAAAFFLSVFWFADWRLNRFLRRRLMRLAGRSGERVSRFLFRNWIAGLVLSIVLALGFAALITLWLDPFISVDGEHNLMLKNDLTAATDELRQRTDTMLDSSEKRIMQQVQQLIEQERSARLDAERELQNAVNRPPR